MVLLSSINAFLGFLSFARNSICARTMMNPKRRNCNRYQMLMFTLQILVRREGLRLWLVVVWRDPTNYKSTRVSTRALTHLDSGSAGRLRVQEKIRKLQKFLFNLHFMNFSLMTMGYRIAGPHEKDSREFAARTHLGKIPI